MLRDIFVHVKNTSIYSQQGYDNILLSSLLIKIQQFVKLIQDCSSKFQAKQKCSLRSWAFQRCKYSMQDWVMTIYTLQKIKCQQYLELQKHINGKSSLTSEFNDYSLVQEQFHQPADFSFYDHIKTFVLLGKKVLHSMEEEIAVLFLIPKVLSTKLCHLKIIRAF